MTERDFCYWLQGFAELNSNPPTAEQWQAIREHLSLVFNKVTPTVVAPFIQPSMPPGCWTDDKMFLVDPASAPRYCFGGGLPDPIVVTC